MFGKEYGRLFKRKQIEFNETELGIILNELMPTASIGDVYKDCNWFWSMNAEGTRRIIIDTLNDVHVIDVTNTTLLSTPEQFKAMFGGDGVTDDTVIDRLAKYDFHRMLKWPLVNHYQRKISILSKY